MMIGFPGNSGQSGQSGQLGILKKQPVIYTDCFINSIITQQILQSPFQGSKV
jgi:hypothetical protein